MANTPPANPNASIEGQALQTLLNVLTASQSPDMLQAQAFLLRRLALEGDVVPSRLPAPLNVSEMGCWVNLLGTLGMTDARSQMIASALGIAGPSPALGTLGEQPPIAWLTLPNDRPIGPQQGSIPLSIQIRADFAPALQAAIQALHDQGCALPLLSPLQVLPPGTAAAPTDLLPLIGRTIWLAPGQALVNPDTDALAVAQLAAGPWQAVSRAASAGPIPVAPQAWSAQTCSASACTVSPPPACRKGLCPFEPGAGQRRLRPNHSRRRAGQRPRLHLVAFRQPDRSRPECDDLRRRVGLALAAGGDRRLLGGQPARPDLERHDLRLGDRKWPLLRSSPSNRR